MKKLFVLILLLAIPSLAFAQTRTITGKVLDDEGQPLIGAGVFNEALKQGAATDLDGSFSIKVSSKENSTLKVSFLGMEDKQILIGPNDNNITISLKSSNQLEAAVVNAGYGVIQKKENLTGSAFEVTHDQLALKPAARIDNLLAAQVPGLSITEDSYNGKTSVSLRVRGDGSLSASNEPLWVVDGVPIYTGSNTGAVAGTNYSISTLSYINPDDIESITVLKDASTTALYGADGANGVILVTTRSGKKGKTSFNASLKYGITTTDRSTRIKYLNGSQYLDIAKEAWINSGRPEAAFPYQDNEYNSYSTTNTDWVDVYTGVGQTTQANFSASGGSDRMTHYFSMSAYNNKSQFIGNRQQRYSISDKTNFKFGEKFTARTDISASYNYNNIFSLPSWYEEIIPIFEPYNEDGSYRMYNYYSTDDKVYTMKAVKFYSNELPDREYNENYQKAINLKGNLTLTYKPVTGLTITNQAGVNLISIYEASYDDSRTWGGQSSNGLDGYSYRSGVFDYVFNENLRGNYAKTFAEKHALNAMAGIEITDKTHPYLQAKGNGFANDHIKEINYAETSTRYGYSGTTHTRSLSYMAFASYTYDRRYTLSLTWRRQGYSSFSEYARWGNFRSLGATWNIHREHFFNVPWIDQLSLKASYGNNGNSRIDTSSSYGAYSMYDNDYYGGTAGANQSSAANPGLSWETTYITNIGINMSFLKRFSLSLEYYNRLTKDLLYKGRVSAVISESNVYRNVGEIRNKGIEFDFNSTNIKNGDFTWTTSINGAHNSNIIEKLYKGMSTGFFNYVWKEGASKDAWYLVRWAGVDPTTGAPMWYDANGDLTYTFNYSDRVVLPEYSKQPILYGGITNNFTWKNWTASVLLDYTLGGWDYFVLQYDGSDAIGTNQPVEVLDHWTQVGEVASNPRFTYETGSHSGYGSTRNLYKKTNIQLRSLTISYKLPQKFCNKMKVNSCLVSLIGDNLYLFTPGQSSKHNSYKTLKYSEGMSRTISAQVSFNF